MGSTWKDVKYNYENKKKEISVSGRCVILISSPKILQKNKWIGTREEVFKIFRKSKLGKS